MTDLGSCPSMGVLIKLTSYVIGAPLIDDIKNRNSICNLRTLFILEFHLFSVHHNGTKEIIRLSWVNIYTPYQYDLKYNSSWAVNTI